MNRCPRVFVVGIDGGSWNVIEEHIDSLQTISDLINEGVAMNLRSTIPPVTCPAWKSFTTGLKPSELGIYWWAHVDFRSGGLRYFYSDSFRGKEIWDYLGFKGYKSLIINVPLTFPPKRVNGIMVSGAPASNSDDYTWPPDVKRELEESIGYRINPTHHVMLEPEKALGELLDLIRKRFEALYYLLDRDSYDFAMIVLFSVDLIQHFYWDDREAVGRAYSIIDRELRRIIGLCPQSNYIVVSDHGFREIKDMFYINKYLLDKGLLNLKHRGSPKLLPSLAQLLLKYGFMRSIITRIYSRMPRLAQVRLKNIIAFRDEHGLDKIVDIRNSYVVGLKQGPIFINKAKLEEEGIDYEDFKENLIKDLLEIKHPDHGRLIEDIYEVETGDRDLNMPDLIILVNDGFEIEIDPLVDSYWSSLTKNSGYIAKWKASHSIHGIFIAYGNDIQKLLSKDDLKRIENYEIPIWSIIDYILKLYNLQGMAHVRANLRKITRNLRKHS